VFCFKPDHLLDAAVLERSCFICSSAIFEMESDSFHSRTPEGRPVTQASASVSCPAPHPQKTLMMLSDELTNDEFANLLRLFLLYSFTPLPLDVEDLLCGICCAGLKVDITFPSSREVHEGDVATLEVTVVHRRRDVSVVNVVGSTAVVVKPEVTSLMNNVIFAAGRAAHGRPVVTAYNSALWRKEIDLLLDFGCLNDELINFYLRGAIPQPPGAIITKCNFVAYGQGMQKTLQRFFM
jgi:hypothetical protein